MTEIIPTHRPKANFYIDGFNLYHGCFDNRQARLHWRAYRWLNLAELCTKLCPEYQVNTIRYFTALVEPLPNNPHNRDRQLVYIRALDTIPNLEIYHGRFATSGKWRTRAQPHTRPPTPIDPHETVYVVEREEKGSDVNLASYLLVDAFSHDFDIAFVVTNDSDLAEPIRLVKELLGLPIAIVNPRKTVAAELQGIADRYMAIREWMLRDSQFPTALRDEHGMITKPRAWSNL